MNSESASEFKNDIREIEKFELYKFELLGLYLHYVYGDSAKFKLFFDLSRTSSYRYSTYRDSTVLTYPQPNYCLFTVLKTLCNHMSSVIWRGVEGVRGWGE